MDGRVDALRCNCVNVVSQNVLGEVIGFKARPTVKEGEDATISNQGLLLYKDPIKLLDIVNIVGRFQTWVQRLSCRMTSFHVAGRYFRAMSTRTSFSEALDMRRARFVASLWCRKCNTIGFLRFISFVGTAL